MFSYKYRVRSYQHLYATNCALYHTKFHSQWYISAENFGLITQLVSYTIGSEVKNLDKLLEIESASFDQCPRIEYTEVTTADALFLNYDHCAQVEVQFIRALFYPNRTAVIT